VGRATIVGRVDELADSAALLGDAGALGRRLAEDGYLFFRGLMPAAQVQAAAGPSRYFAVHPRWRHWQPPGGAVH
jgi:hypothetical protein